MVWTTQKRLFIETKLSTAAETLTLKNFSQRRRTYKTQKRSPTSLAGFKKKKNRSPAM